MKNNIFSYLVPDFITSPVKSRLAPGKKLVMILTQNNPDEKNFTNVLPKFDHFFRAYGFDETLLIRACGVNVSGEAASREDVMMLAEKTAEKLCGRA